eukprot:CAMPEP_0194104130 /NCGR_PEP_ID=MMETSP0150-20130528/4485_1 /TAXON_ID=122233 /ORGANISM="Chaetoceros debilis, Strain MM31A-1" /LENGTH=476 /DNA_ID=CAMNT_0038791555 /DNA_START=270 /DNA_END=1700 /DNA_ORIENTATION=-
MSSESTNNGNDNAARQRDGGAMSRGKGNNHVKKNMSFECTTQGNKNQDLEKNRKKTSPKKFKYSGNLPDLSWRAIPIEHLRSHPLFIPLPHPDTIKNINKLEDVRMFRQDSWQWDELHRGRCTTSQAAPALGFLEPKAAMELGIPRSLQKGCSRSFQRLGESALRSKKDMNEILCVGGNGGEHRTFQVWTKASKSSAKKGYPFAFKYLPVYTMGDKEKRKVSAEEYMCDLKNPMRVRMQWGNLQEPTAILTALNYFSNLDSDLRVREVGMCGAEIDINKCSTNMEEYGNDSKLKEKEKILVGASPDAVLEYSNGSSEVLEVKNHCPFVPTEWMTGGKKKKKKSKFRIRELPMQAKVPSVYIPQLMMEMLCVGKSCRSAVMVRQTATCGAVILRLHRDDEWIEEMLYWISSFKSQFVDKEAPPPPNFFYEGNEKERYKKFIQWTKALSEDVDLVEHVQHGRIQRVLHRGVGMSLFLD